MLLMAENSIRGRICHTNHRYAEANSKYIKNYDKKKELSDLKYWDKNNLYGCAMSQKLPSGGCKCVEETCQFNEDFIKSYNDDSDEGYFLKVDVQYPENLHNFHNDLSFLHERMKIKKGEKLVANWNDKKEYVIHIRNLKQVMNHGLVLKKVYIFIKLNQEA